VRVKSAAFIVVLAAAWATAAVAGKRADVPDGRGARTGRLFWESESWLADMQLPAKDKKAASAHRRWESAVERCEAVIESDAVTPAERRYFEALEAFLMMDFPAARRAWGDLEAVPAYRDEVQWLLFGPRAGFYREASSDWRWRRAAAFFRDGRRAAGRGDWAGAIPFFERALREKPDHALAERFLGLARQRREEEKASRRAVEWPTAVKAFLGTDAERSLRAEEAFRRGEWSVALAWADSLAQEGVTEEGRRRGKKSVRRLGWMFSKANKGKESKAEGVHGNIHETK
jgi:tetratricopeptide (TPR) repeat protein